MKNLVIGLAALALSPAACAEEAPASAPSPNEIVAAAPPSDWVQIPAEDLLVMDLAPDAEGNQRRVVIQLIPAPFSQGWVHNIKLLAKSGWYDNISVNRVQDNYVVQWGDPNYDNPEATGETKPLPEGLRVLEETEYVTPPYHDGTGRVLRVHGAKDTYADWARISSKGWPIAGTEQGSSWPVHCYGMVGVGRNYSPDTGSGAELYTVIGHAPRQLDRNIALVGRIIEGMEHLSSLPRGKGELGFYADFEKDRRTPIRQVRIASDLHEIPQPAFEYLSTESESFAKYAEARANRRDAFFIHPAGGADICNIPVPVRRIPGE
ncbi:peptidylprolyl isomerase [Altererythrobacter sp. BO-6]|uniref:peptidylprolyl isomerase n=1 Tax=Altererythrobacter sp. BO-6 TaxID=2604537 RepID=UPI0013E1F346|nr:peptidylprolyl isomerase [Altererythrobacter sp. BO-6]QIG53655.1 peptidylprolyl isomerase [Altererythrobacter sp. BO-6]